MLLVLCVFPLVHRIIFVNQEQVFFRLQKSIDSEAKGVQAFRWTPGHVPTMSMLVLCVFPLVHRIIFARM